MHTLLDLRGNHPKLHPRLGRQAARRSRPRSAAFPKRGAIYVMNRGYVDFARLLCIASGWRLLRHPRQVEPGCPPRLLRRRPIGRPVSLRPDHRVRRLRHQQGLSVHLRRVRFKDPESGKTLVFSDKPIRLAGGVDLRPLQKPLQVELFFKWIKQHLRIKQFYGTFRQRGEDANLDRGFSVYVLVAIIKKRLALEASSTL